MAHIWRTTLMAALLGTVAAAAQAQEAVTPPTDHNFNAAATEPTGGLAANSNSRTVMRNAKPAPGETATKNEAEITRQLNMQQASLGAPAPNTDLENADKNKTPQTEVSAAINAQKTVRDPNNQMDSNASSTKGSTPDVAPAPTQKSADK